MFDKIKDIIFKIKDYDRLEHDYACILDYITDGRLSKTNYRVEGLYTVIDDILTERDERTRKEIEKEILKEDTLPSNLDEAAKEYANKEHPDEPCVGRWGTGDYEPPVDREYDREIVKDAFKAGAEWVIKQLKEK